MEHPEALKDYWTDLEKWLEDRPDPHSDEWHVSEKWAEQFQRHLENLRPLATEGNLEAQHAMASIYLVGMLYPDEETELERRVADRKSMTALLVSAARGGLVGAFDNLVTSGVGDDAEEARRACKEYKKQRKPVWSEQDEMPVYTPEWMSGAMKIWQGFQGQ